MQVVYRVRPLGTADVPRHGGVLLVANHVSYLDAFFIAVSLKRFLFFLIDAPWYDLWPAFFKYIYTIRVPHGTRRSILDTIESARTELKKGHMVCIFAEGSITLSGNLAEFRRGVERIVRDLDVAVIPVHLGGLWGSVFSRNPRASIWRSLRHRRLVTLIFGKPVAQPTTFHLRQAVSELSVEAARLALPKGDKLVAQFVRSARRHWSHPALLDSAGHSVTYGELLVRSRLLSVVFRSNPPALPASEVATPAVFEDVSLSIAIALAGVEKKHDWLFPRGSVRSFTKGEIALETLRSRWLPVRWITRRSSPQRELQWYLNAFVDLWPLTSEDIVAGTVSFTHWFGLGYRLWLPLLHGAAIIRGDHPSLSKTVLLRARTNLEVTLHRVAGTQPALNGFGSRDDQGVLAVNLPDQERPGIKQPGSRAGTVGQTIPGVAAKIVNLSTRELLPAGEIGTLFTKTPFHDWSFVGCPAMLDNTGFLTIFDSFADR